MLRSKDLYWRKIASFERSGLPNRIRLENQIALNDLYYKGYRIVPEIVIPSRFRKNRYPEEKSSGVSLTEILEMFKNRKLSLIQLLKIYIEVFEQLEFLIDYYALIILDRNSSNIRINLFEDRVEVYQIDLEGILYTSTRRYSATKKIKDHIGLENEIVSKDYLKHIIRQEIFVLIDPLHRLLSSLKYNNLKGLKHLESLRWGNFANFSEVANTFFYILTLNLEL